MQKKQKGLSAGSQAKTGSTGAVSHSPQWKFQRVEATSCPQLPSAETKAYHLDVPLGSITDHVWPKHCIAVVPYGVFQGQRLLRREQEDRMVLPCTT